MLTERIHNVETQAGLANNEIGLLKSRLELSQAMLPQYEEMAAEGFLSKVHVQSKLEDQLDINGRLQALRRGHLGLQQDRQALVGERQGLQAQFDLDDAQLARSQSLLQQDASENAARQSAVISAPGSTIRNPVRFRITAMNLQPGQAVQAGQTLATLVPEQADGQTSVLEAQLYAPSRTAGFVQPGQMVYLRYAAYPYQKFGLHIGHVTSISATPFAVNELPTNLAQQLSAQSGSAEALYRIRVKLDFQSITSHGQNYSLKAGLALDADVLQESRKIWEWVLAPLLSVRSQLKVLGTSH